MKEFFTNHKKIDNLEVFKYSKKKDKRGYSFTIFLKKYFKNIEFSHDKLTYSVKNSLRGMHSDDKTSKLITCLFGEIYCNIVNDDKKSKFYKKKYSFNLKQNISIFIPPKMLLGWCVLSKDALLSYKFSYKGNYSDVEKQKTVKYNDPEYNLTWPVKDKNILLSKRDKN
tara:strand:+ start:252 stop:758 length:507 start_codon:yes stop_codon:yes gene_type:complete